MDVVEVLATYGGDAGTGDAAGTANEVDAGGAAMVGGGCPPDWWSTWHHSRLQVIMFHIGGGVLLKVVSMSTLIICIQVHGFLC